MLIIMEFQRILIQNLMFLILFGLMNTPTMILVIAQSRAYYYKEGLSRSRRSD